jgi:putative chitinase
MIHAAQWLHVLMAAGVHQGTAAFWCQPFQDEVQPERFSAGMDDILAFLPEILHETTGRNADGGFSPLECLRENLNYSADRICAVWPGRFPTTLDSARYAWNPQALANCVYANRMGNGPEESGDGWTYAGAGLIMLTGKAAYLHVGDRIGQDLTVNPSLLLQPHYGLDAAIGWWEGDVTDDMLSDQVRLRRRVNGGLIGLPEVQRLAGLVTKAFA